jgi:hypothetical protein
VLPKARAFQDAGKLAEHLRDRIVAKGTSVDISADLATRKLKSSTERVNTAD